MAIKKSELYSSLWESCDALRGSMDASQYKDYVLVMLFIKYISDKWAGQPYAPITIPKGSSFADMTALKGSTDIGDQINKKILAPIAAANNLAKFPDFNDPTKLGSDKEMIDTLDALIGIFENPALDFSKNKADGDDILGDAYEFLMRHFATQSGKSKGQFYTPSEVSRTMASIIGINNVDTNSDITVYDPTCGSGSLLLKVGTEAKSKVTLYGQEKDATTAGLARMNMILHDNPTAEIKQGNTLSKPLFEDPKLEANLKTFDFVVANPPFSDKRWSNGLTLPDDKYNRFADYGIPPSKNGDYAFLLHIVRSLKRNGKGAIILPHGVLFRGNAESEIRTNLIKKGFIKGIIGLPANLFYGTGIPAAIIFIDKENAANRKGIFMIDAGKGFIKDGNKNRLREQDIRRITDVFAAQKEVKGFSRMVSIEDISKNEYNLNIPRYIDNQEKEDIQDIEAHLKGGIPIADIDDLSNFWEVYPTLRKSLFEKINDKYSNLTIENEQIKDEIYSHPEFERFITQMDSLFNGWKQKNTTVLKALDKGNKPKQVIANLAEDLLQTYHKKALIDKYNVYQLLLSYWNETMQDDCYIVSADGWVAETYRIYKENAKKKMVDKGWTCDLVPKELVINKYFETEKKGLEILETEKENAISTRTALEEEYNAEGNALFEVSKKAEALENLSEFMELALEKYFPSIYTKNEGFKEELEQISNQLSELNANDVIDHLKNSKGAITKKAITNQLALADPNSEEEKILNKWLNLTKKIASKKKELKTIVDTLDKNIATKTKEDPKQEYIAEIGIINQYLQLLEDETALKAKIKIAEKELDEKLYAKYPTLTETEVKQLVVDDKWTQTIESSIKGEIDHISQRLTNRIKELEERYATPLPQIDQDLTDLETKVNAHLTKMGFVWN
ncbi:type I restriction-modification system, M subunit [Cellulophaga algicola DSM 14237]|uniref:site-specific DNA-methyltransferase (adenine-specific) n=1 Tax=Cellulophaga algicola (strain DSM 14237 / IC166 / ACAM 630) TaxID=688270 RepID=E6X614_CELAD|nr:type I restriction-modification system subunit M [Cellulophaga algicola]ADV50573.1 type I restriction-modification system, M subunit [Cellulophaga algicola DSM 14237]